jgi:hypothetical protein
MVAVNPRSCTRGADVGVADPLDTAITKPNAVEARGTCVVIVPEAELETSQRLMRYDIPPVTAVDDIVNSYTAPAATGNLVPNTVVTVGRESPLV